MAAALAVLAMGCNKEQVAVEGTPDGQEVTVTFTAGLPGTPATKAIGDGTTAKNLVVAVYENDAEKSELASLRKTATFTDLKTTVNFSLVKGKTYNFIFWAQSYDVNAQNSPYDITDLRNIGIKYDGDANDEARDAFFAVRKDVKITGALTETIELKRPFAQVNFGTADYDAAVAAGVAPAKSTISAKDIATVFNPFTGEGTGSATATFTTATAFPTDPAKITVEGNAYQYLAMNYIIPTGKVSEKHVSEITAKFYDDNDVQVGEDVIVPSAPVQANWRTNIVGNLFTDQVIFNVEIKPAFEDDENIDLQNISTAAALKALFKNGGSAKLTADIELESGLVLAAGKDAVIDLNGFDIINKSAGAAIAVNGSLEINGNGTVNGGQGGNNKALQVNHGGKITINGGTFTVGTDASGEGNSCIETFGGDIVINGGYFSTAAGWRGWYYVLNQKNDNPGTITVYGGQFENYDPSTGDDNLHGNFLAQDCVSEPATIGGKTVYTVYRTVTNAAAFASALSNGNNVKLTEDVALDETVSVSVGQNVIVDLNGKTLNNTEDIWDKISNGWSLISVKGGTLTIKGNGVVKAKENDSYAVDVQDGGHVIIEDGEYVGNIHAVYVEEGTAEIRGGKYSVQQKYPKAGLEDEFVLNCYDAHRANGTASIIVYGGEYENFNPADCKAEGAGTNFVAEGYKSVFNNGWYKVVEE